MWVLYGATTDDKIWVMQFIGPLCVCVSVKESESHLTGTLMEGAVYHIPENMFTMKMNIWIHENNYHGYG